MTDDGPRTRSRRAGRGVETRRRVLDATLQTLRDEGMAGTSARSIAKVGGFAPGVLFYYYDSIEDVLLAAARLSAEERIGQFREQLEAVASLEDLVAVARAIHAADAEHGHVAVFAQMLAATAGNAEMGQRLHDVFEPWFAMIADTLQRVLGDVVTDLVEPADLAYATTALFLGLELLEHLGGDSDRVGQLFDSFDELAEIAGALLALARFGTR